MVPGRDPKSLARGAVACHACDWLQERVELSSGERARCARCGTELFRSHREGFDRPIALTVAAAVCFGLANTFPLLALSLEGRVQHSTILDGVLDLAADGLWIVAGFVFLVTMAVPFLQIAGRFYLLLPLSRGRRAPGFHRSLRSLSWLGPWGMLEVYLLGVIVAIVKLSDLAQVEIGVAFYAFLALIVLEIAAAASLDPHAIFEAAETAQ